MTILLQNGSTITSLDGSNTIRGKGHFTCVTCGRRMVFVTNISDDGDPVCENCWDDYCSPLKMEPTKTK